MAPPPPHSLSVVADYNLWRAYLHTGHASRVVGGGITKGDVGNELKSKLSGVQQLHQGLVLLVALHWLLHHDPSVEDFLQHAWQDPFTHRGLHTNNRSLSKCMGEHTAKQTQQFYKTTTENYKYWCPVSQRFHNFMRNSALSSLKYNTYCIQVACSTELSQLQQH